MSVSDVNNQALQAPAQALQVASNLVQAMTAAGIAAVVGGAAGVVGAALALLGAILMVFDDTDSKIAQLQQEINQLGLDAREQNILQRATDLNTVMSACRTAYRNLKARMDEGSAVSDDYADGQLTFCMQTLEAIVPSSSDASLATPTTMPLWFVVMDYQPQIYFSALRKNGSAFGASFAYIDLEPINSVQQLGRERSLVPMTFSQYLVPVMGAFCPIWTLPAYLHALGVFLAVGLGLRRDFFKRKEYRDEIRRHAEFLSQVYKKILGDGFVFLPMPRDPSVADPKDNPYGSENWPTLWYRGPVVPTLDTTYGWDGYSPQTWWDPQWLSGYCQPFGCVDRFTGDYVLGNFPVIPPSRLLPADTPNKPHLLTMFYQGLLLAALRSGKQLYQKEQLGGVRSTVNSWCQLIGEPPLLPEPCFGDWSMREVFEVVSDPAAAVPEHPERLENARLDSLRLSSLIGRLRQSCFTSTPLGDEPGLRSIRHLLSWQ